MFAALCESQRAPRKEKLSYGMLGLTNGDSLSSTNTFRTVKFAGIIVAKAWLVKSIDPSLPKAIFAGES